MLNEITNLNQKEYIENIQQVNNKLLSNTICDF